MRARRWAAPTGWLLMVIACTPEGAEGWTVRSPVWIRQTGTIADVRLRESSGAARGRVNPELVWTHNDSGNDPLIFAIDTTGAVRAVLTVAGARNRDWEAIAAGPCGDEACLYLGDVGDNTARRRDVVLYRLLEPDLRGRTDDRQRPSIETVRIRDSVRVHLERGPRDIEAMVLAADGDVALISKGWRERPLVFRVSGSAWETGSALAAVVDSLPIRTGVFHGQLITDAALSPDFGTLAVRSYTHVFLFRSRGGDSAWLPDDPVVACDIRGREPQGEGLTWWGEALLLTSERPAGQVAPIHVLRCDAP